LPVPPILFPLVRILRRVAGHQAPAAP
jgi:hypothetical protein